jgi:hypothetical protein
MSDTTPADDGQEYPLADMLSELANELEMANKRVVQAGRPGRLRWTEATVELGVTWERKGDGGIDLKVVRLGGGLTKANTTTISVKVVPVQRAGAATVTALPTVETVNDSSVIGVVIAPEHIRGLHGDENIDIDPPR